MIEFVDAGYEHVQAARSFINKCRMTWSVYYPCPTEEYLNDFVAAKEACEFYHCTVALDGQRVVGIVSACIDISHNGMPICQNHVVLVDTTLPPFVMYSVITRLLDKIYIFAKEQHCYRIAWTIGTGKWEALQKIISRKFPSTQVGVCLNSEIV